MVHLLVWLVSHSGASNILPKKLIRQKHHPTLDPFEPSNLDPEFFYGGTWALILPRTLWPNACSSSSIRKVVTPSWSRLVVG
jgi:hypothetical protein